MYELITDPITSQILSIKRLADGAFIPVDESNADYQVYLDWVSKGSKPLPAE